jgi:hypothetical protein
MTVEGLVPVAKRSEFKRETNGPTDLYLERLLGLAASE